METLGTSGGSEGSHWSWPGNPGSIQPPNVCSATEAGPTAQKPSTKCMAMIKKNNLM